MLDAPALPALYQLSDLTRFLSPGLVTGVFDAGRWVDWDSGDSPGIVLLTSSRPHLERRGEAECFHCVLDLHDRGSQGQHPAACLLERLRGRSRGIALISSHAGFLVRWSHRILLPGPLPRERLSGPQRPRTSGARLAISVGTLRLIDPAEVLRSATLSIGLDEPSDAISALGPGFPDLQIDARAAHVTLGGHTAEEVLARLREEGARVRASTVWYSLLQSPPVIHAG
jgi:hypothetical protein